jgi:two-component system cell cycle sensor histidine kinase/response regulator CckA
MARLDWLLKRSFFTATVYATISWIWISTSDTLVHQANLSYRAEELISIAKGSIFVGGTALLIYFLLRLANRELASAARAEATLQEAMAALSSANAMLLELTHDAKARLASIVEGSEDAILGYRLDGVITDWNQAATRLYGYPAEEAIGCNASFLVPISRADELTEILNTVAAGGRIQQFETVRQRKDGSLMDVSFSVSPITGQDGTIIGGSAIVHDVTNPKRMEEALRRSEERFRLVSRATKDAIWDLDIRSGETWRSENFWEHFGYLPRDAEPDIAGWKDLLHPEDRERVWKAFQTALLRQSDSYEIEYRFRREDGSYAVVLDRAYIVYDETGQPTRAIGAITDLSEHRELEEQFRQAQKMEAVGRLAGGIAHDFNNLLMVITTYTEMAREQPLSQDKLLKNLAEVLRAAERAAALTHQLLAFSRKQVLSPRIIDINIVIEESLKMIQRLIGEDIELNVSLGETLWAVKADPGQIVQVVMNLRVNARDAMHDGGELKIETKNLSVDVETARKHPSLVPGNYVALAVSDKGTGMTQEVQAHLFDPFFTTKESGKGTGLGLATVYGIVKQSEGYVWVDSELGRGSLFSLYFPAVDAPLTTILTPEIAKSEGQGEIILLVEDEDALRESISSYLNLHGYKVLEAANGAQALHSAKGHAHSIKVLITDVILPKLSGVEVAREVAKMSPQVVTLYMSGYTDRKLVDYDPASSTTGFLQKPFALRTLLEKLGQMIVRRG